MHSIIALSFTHIPTRGQVYMPGGAHVLLDVARFYTAKVLKQALHSPLLSVSLVLNYVQNFFFHFP